MKVKMLCRHGGKTGTKLEQGLSYELPDDYAMELIRHGLAIKIQEPPKEEIKPEEKIVTPRVYPTGYVSVNKKPPRNAMGKFSPKGKGK